MSSWLMIILQNPHYVLSSCLYKIGLFAQCILLVMAAPLAPVKTHHLSTFEQSLNLLTPPLMKSVFPSQTHSHSLYCLFDIVRGVVSFAFVPSSVESRQEYLFWGTALVQVNTNVLRQEAGVGRLRTWWFLASAFTHQSKCSALGPAVHAWFLWPVQPDMA